MQIDLAKSAEENLLALVAVTNPSAPTQTSKVTISEVQIDTNPEDANDNSSALLTAVSGQGYTGFVKVYYSRLSLHDAVDAVTPGTAATITAVPSETITDILLAFASKYRLDVSQLTTEDEAAPVPGGGAQNITIQSIVDSPLYIQAVAVTVDWTA